MTFYIYDDGGDFARECSILCERAGMLRVGSPEQALVAIAPRLTRKLSRREWSAPDLGTLIFHPSALPYRRGPDAIRRAVAAGERVSGVTWFWCDDGLDTGPICAQEPVVLHPGESAGRAYHTRFVPAGLQALAKALPGIVDGVPRREPQDEALATYDSFLTA